MFILIKQPPKIRLNVETSNEEEETVCRQGHWGIENIQRWRKINPGEKRRVILFTGFGRKLRELSANDITVYDILIIRDKKNEANCLCS